MIIKKESFYTMLKPSEDLKKNNSENILEFHKNFDEKYHKFKNDNLILDFSANNNMELEEILLFSQKSKSHKKENKSFVIVCKGLDYNILPAELMAVPTLREAEDMIELEDIERDLGF